jgi:hypothetical protein
MESWVVGYEGDDDVERHAGSLTPDSSSTADESPVRGRGEQATETPPLNVRVISDYI